MGDEGWGGGGLFFSTDPKCLWNHVSKPDQRSNRHVKFLRKKNAGQRAENP